MHCKNEIFKIVLYIMDEKKVSRLHLARLMNKDPSAVCRYFRDNDYFSVSLLYLEDICKALEIELSVLVGKCDELFYNGH